MSPMARVEITDADGVIVPLEAIADGAALKTPLRIKERGSIQFREGHENRAADQMCIYQKYIYQKRISSVGAV